MTTEDRRRAPRRDVQVEVEIAAEKNVIEADTLNLSKGGAFVRTTKPIDIGAPVEINLSVPNHAFPVTVRGEVVRREAFDKEAGDFAVPGLGIRFTDLSPDAQQALDLITGGGVEKSPKTRRLPIHLKVSYTSLASFANFYASDIAKGGIYIETDKLLPVGTEFEFQMAVPGVPAPVKLIGEVMWVHEPTDGEDASPGMGIKFHYRNAMHQKMLEDIVAEHLRQVDSAK